MAKVKTTITSSGGCTVTVDGTVDVKLNIKEGVWNVVSFTGTIKLGGKASCPQGTITFKHGVSGRRLSTDREVIATVHGKDLRAASKITWQGSDPRITALLNDHEVSKAVCEQLRAATEAKEKAPRISETGSS